VGFGSWSSYLSFGLTDTAADVGAAMLWRVPLQPHCTEGSPVRRTLMALAALIVLGVWSGIDVHAQKGVMWRGGGGWGHGTPYGRMYNARTVETIHGVVVSLDSITPMKGMSYGVHAMLKTDKETIPVHLGPAWYVENQDVRIIPKDTLEVKGSRITLEGKPVVIAAEVRMGEDVLVLRDVNGFPAWSGWRRRSGD
jgi:hypothetical protein